MEPTTKLIKNSHALVAGKLTESSLIPKRKDMIEKLQKEEFDILIIGGGATGSGKLYE